MSVLLGAIADDFTGATDLCNTLVRRGMRTVQLIDVPASGTAVADAEAVVVALKSRTIPAAEAIEKSLAALDWLRRAGARQILFKYCSTFDSTDEGNIGPVAEALMDALGSDFTLFCPAFPETGRTIYLGYLFVGDVLLSESGMRDHPLTPMRDPSLVRVCSGSAGARSGSYRSTMWHKAWWRSATPLPRCSWPAFGTRSSMRSRIAISRPSALRPRISS